MNRRAAEAMSEIACGARLQAYVGAGQRASEVAPAVLSDSAGIRSSQQNFSSSLRQTRAERIARPSLRSFLSLKSQESAEFQDLNCCIQAESFFELRKSKSSFTIEGAIAVYRTY